MEKEKGLYSHGGLIQGIVVLSLTFLVVTLIPLIGPIVVIMIPLPILYYYSLLGRVRGLAALAVAFVAVCGLLGLFGQGANSFVLLMIGFTGVMVAEILKRRYTLEKTFILAVLVFFSCGIGVLLSYSLLSGMPPWRMVTLYIEGIISENLKLYEQLNIASDQISVIRENAQQITFFLTGIFPALALSGSMITVWLNVLAGRALFRRKRLAFLDFGDLSLWKAPEKLVWLLIIAGAMTLAQIDLLEIVGLNLLIICCMVYLFQGLAIASFFFRTRKIPVIFRWLFYFFIVIQHYLAILVIAFGLFDIWVDFRKRIAGMNDAPA